MRSWELITRPAGSLDFTWEGISTDVRMLGALAEHLIDAECERTGARRETKAIRATLAEYVAKAHDGVITKGFSPSLPALELFLGRHDNMLRVVMNGEEPPDTEGPLDESAMTYLGRISHDGWQHWIYLAATGRFHINPFSFDWFYGDEVDSYLVPVTTEQFVELAARGVGDPRERAPHLTSMVGSWESVAVEDCAPELAGALGRG